MWTEVKHNSMIDALFLSFSLVRAHFFHRDEKKTTIGVHIFLIYWSAKERRRGLKKTKDKLVQSTVYGLSLKCPTLPNRVQTA